MDNYLKLKGHIQAYRVREGYKELVYEHSNTIGTTLYANLRNTLLMRGVDYCVDAMAWGSFRQSAGSFIDGTFAGTTSFGTGGNLIQSAIGNSQARFSGTFSFTTTKQINSFQLGDGYIVPGPGVSQLFTNLYCFDNSLIAGTTFLTYINGDQLILDWTITIGN